MGITKGETESGGPRGTPRMERSERRVMGMGEGEEPEKRDKGRAGVIQPDPLTLGRVGVKAESRPLGTNHIPGSLKRIGGPDDDAIIQVPEVKKRIQGLNLSDDGEED